MSEPYLIDLKARLLIHTYICEDGCWHCELGGSSSRYGSVFYKNENISNHVASWLVHKGPIPEGMCVLHTCDYKRCINPDHLFLGTKGDNNSDRKTKGRNSNRSGANNHMARLTEENVKEIKYFLVHSGMTQKAIADYFGVGPTVISQIKTGARWAHV